MTSPPLHRKHRADQALNISPKLINFPIQFHPDLINPNPDQPSSVFMSASMSASMATAPNGPHLTKFLFQSLSTHVGETNYAFDGQSDREVKSSTQPEAVCRVQQRGRKLESRPTRRGNQARRIQLVLDSGDKTRGGRRRRHQGSSPAARLVARIHQSTS